MGCARGFLDWQENQGCAVSKSKNTDAEKRKSAQAKPLKSLERRQHPFNVELAPRELVKVQKFNSGIFRSN